MVLETLVFFPAQPTDTAGSPVMFYYIDYNVADIATSHCTGFHSDEMLYLQTSLCMCLYHNAIFVCMITCIILNVPRFLEILHLQFTTNYLIL
jgi:hypothetical protein